MKVTYSSDAYPAGQEMTVSGLPVTLKNKQAVEVDEDAQAAYLAVTGNKLADALKGDKQYKIGGGESK